MKPDIKTLLDRGTVEVIVRKDLEGKLKSGPALRIVSQIASCRVSYACLDQYHAASGVVFSGDAEASSKTGSWCSKAGSVLREAEKPPQSVVSFIAHMTGRFGRWTSCS
jgi:hypothetical protein